MSRSSSPDPAPNVVDLLAATEFRLADGMVYLNHAAVAPWPQRTANAVQAFARENAAEGARHYPRWLTTEQALRSQAANLINADASEVAFTKNTSEGLSIVAHGFPWTTGENVVVPKGEFPSNRIVWQSLARCGVETREVDLSADDDPEDRLVRAMDRHTRLLAVSSVQFATGLRLDLGRLGEACRARGVAFCVDAIQGLGALAHDVSAMGISFLAADAHKWLLGPEGIALLYCHPQWRDRLTLREFGWHMVEHASDFERADWTPARSARRFEPGSPNMLGIHALSASLSLLLEIGLDTIERRILERAQQLIDGLRALPRLEMVSPTQPGRYGGIVTFRALDLDAARLFSALQARDVICAQRGGGIRFSPHFYTTPALLNDALERTANAMRAVQTMADTR